MKTLAVGLLLSLTLASPVSSKALSPMLPDSSGAQLLKIRTYPDPFMEHFTLVIPAGVHDHLRADLLDGSYRCVMEWPLGFAATPGSIVDVPTNGLQPGTYTLRIWDEHGDVGATVIQCQ